VEPGSTDRPAGSPTVRRRGHHGWLPPAVLPARLRRAGRRLAHVSIRTFERLAGRASRRTGPACVWPVWPTRGRVHGPARLEVGRPPPTGLVSFGTDRNRAVL